jgi:hypothetical protein
LWARQPVGPLQKSLSLVGVKILLSENALVGLEKAASLYIVFCVLFMQVNQPPNLVAVNPPPIHGSNKSEHKKKDFHTMGRRKESILVSEVPGLDHRRKYCVAVDWY